MSDNYKVNALNDNIKIYTTSDHNFGTDAFLLSYFAKPEKNEVVADFGTGCGIIPFLMAKDYNPKLIYGIEIDKNAIAMLRSSLEISWLTETVIPICMDIRAMKGNSIPQRCDLVVCNPPYFKSGSGFEPTNEAKKTVRHDTTLTASDICKSAKKILNYGGRLCICQRPDRLVDLLCEMRSNGVEPKRLRFVIKENGEKPWLCLVEGRVGGNPSLDVEEAFAVYSNGEYSEEMKKVYLNSNN